MTTLPSPDDREAVKKWLEENISYEPIETDFCVVAEDIVRLVRAAVERERERLVAIIDALADEARRDGHDHDADTYTTASGAISRARRSPS